MKCSRCGRENGTTYHYGRNCNYCGFVIIPLLRDQIRQFMKFKEEFRQWKEDEKHG